VELRRALLLFAIVLGLAAIVSSLARPPVGEDQDDRGAPPAGSDAPTQPTASSRPAARRTPEIRFVVGGKRKTETLTAGTAATVTVAVEEPGQVSIAGLGLTGQAAPLTPARFDVLSTRPGRYAVRFTAVPDDRSRLLGFLQVVPAPLP
jgi:hypothetical protein